MALLVHVIESSTGVVLQRHSVDGRELCAAGGWAPADAESAAILGLPVGSTVPALSDPVAPVAHEPAAPMASDEPAPVVAAPVVTDAAPAAPPAPRKPAKRSRGRV